MPKNFDEYLRDLGLAESTISLYERIAARAQKDPAAFLKREITSTTPAGTALSYAAACRHLLTWQGIDPEEARLPKLRRRQREFRDALDEGELAAWGKAVEKLPEPYRTIVALLPLTGLRIAEICALPAKALTKEGRVPGFQVVGKGDKARFVPLGASARGVLKAWLQSDHRPTSAWLFPSPQSTDRPVTPGAVRLQLRAMRGALPGLAKRATPHVLRHTYATRVLAAGGGLKELADLLGHSSTRTTERYLHPSADRLAALVDDL